MAYYETTLVVDTVLEESAIKEKVQHYVTELIGHGAKILEVDHRGVRKLAYDIKGKDGTWRNQADYTFIHYDAPGNAITPVEALLKLDEDILRFMTVRPRFQPEFAGGEQPEGDAARSAPPAPSDEEADKPSADETAEDSESEDSDEKEN